MSICRCSRCGDGRCVKYSAVRIHTAKKGKFVPIQHRNGDPWRMIYISCRRLLPEKHLESPSEPVSLAVRKPAASKKKCRTTPRTLSPRRSICRGPFRIWRMRGMATGTKSKGCPGPDSGRDEVSAVQPPARPPEMNEAFSTLSDLR